MAQIQIQKLAKKEEGKKRGEEGLEGYTEILQEFYRVYSIVQTVSAQLSWSHFVELIYLNNKEERQFYEQQAIQNAWSVRELRRQIRSNLYERAKSEGEITIIQPIAKALQPEQVFKDTYNFDFLKLPEKYSEDDLKTALLNTFSFFKRKPVLKEKQKISCENLCNLWL